MMIPTDDDIRQALDPLTWHRAGDNRESPIYGPRVDEVVPVVRRLIEQADRVALRVIEEQAATIKALEQAAPSSIWHDRWVFLIQRAGHMAVSRADYSARRFWEFVLHEMGDVEKELPLPAPPKETP